MVVVVGMDNGEKEEDTAVVLLVVFVVCSE